MFEEFFRDVAPAEEELSPKRIADIKSAVMKRVSQESEDKTMKKHSLRWRKDRDEALYPPRAAPCSATGAQTRPQQARRYPLRKAFPVKNFVLRNTERYIPAPTHIKHCLIV